ncbi:viroplasmin family protein [Leadbetterella byssophila]|uniref:Ribonuclease H n=1 Tax=Leadbetterella byssophila (strain DSM 17132 / JCM 16389 / KACC 11308 / NBRC 106382 / 4M15) TaxID=649349 RepID=E4RZ67_LEAB4|nr:ribonuclease H family protein [Leadbetterella byssophila]ADQ19185.1 ribonuclease H-related protein [Leadbetterella byssophila DSM 17132]
MGKVYVVWKGRETGILEDWDSCKKSVEGFEGAQYKSFKTRREAEEALKKGFFKSVQAPKPSIKQPLPNFPAWVVDAAWNTKTGDMEYQGVDLLTRKKLFHKGPFPDGTNNIGEFLAIVHALALLHKHGSDAPIFSDSKTAISWVKKKQANTKLERTPRNGELFVLLERAEHWLRTHPFQNKILKWETEWWGENPADFGRK